MCLRPTFYCLKDLLEPIIAPKLLRELSLFFNMLPLVQVQVSSAYKYHPSPGKSKSLRLTSSIPAVFCVLSRRAGIHQEPRKPKLLHVPLEGLCRPLI